MASTWQMIQLNPSIPMITPKGSGEAIILIDYGPEFDLMFTVALDNGGELWTFKNSELRLHKNLTLGRVDKQ